MKDEAGTYYHKHCGYSGAVPAPHFLAQQAQLATLYPVLSW
ncbi:hypothetical protein SAMN04488523_101407 [Sulfitobacter brevis]|uniref:Uncharacterized protein n=1 Tax=Sulfitobacter brevis TaxID=74348 RepID=A0A1I1TN23_9RHOB|nr:hypothetical protein SAMN04488523_101407 [Sulfitobacter brevis]